MLMSQAAAGRYLLIAVVKTENRLRFAIGGDSTCKRLVNVYLHVSSTRLINYATAASLVSTCR